MIPTQDAEGLLGGSRGEGRGRGRGAKRQRELGCDRASGGVGDDSESVIAAGASFGKARGRGTRASEGQKNDKKRRVTRQGREEAAAEAETEGGEKAQQGARSRAAQDEKKGEEAVREVLRAEADLEEPVARLLERLKEALAVTGLQDESVEARLQCARDRLRADVAKETSSDGAGRMR